MVRLDELHVDLYNYFLGYHEGEICGGKGGDFCTLDYIGYAAISRTRFSGCMAWLVTNRGNIPMVRTNT